jgi:hypothetical protein
MEMDPVFYMGQNKMIQVIALGTSWGLSGLKTGLEWLVHLGKYVWCEN